MTPGACPRGVLGRFGLCEFEKAADAILAYLADPGRSADIPEWLGPPGPAVGWEKLFRVYTIPEVPPALFAAMCAAGWIDHAWFPKWTFRVSDGFRRRACGEPDAGAPAVVGAPTTEGVV